MISISNINQLNRPIDRSFCYFLGSATENKLYFKIHFRKDPIATNLVVHCHESSANTHILKYKCMWTSTKLNKHRELNGITVFFFFWIRQMFWRQGEQRNFNMDKDVPLKYEHLGSDECPSTLYKLGFQDLEKPNQVLKHHSQHTCHFQELLWES